MAKIGARRAVQESVLDRLIESDGISSSALADEWAESVRLLKISLRRDLEWLLNTRRTIIPVPEDYQELRRSVFHFGIPDIASMSKDEPDTYSRLVRQVEEAIAIFEPRLANTRVSLVSGDSGDRRQLHFLIEGLLRMDPMPERVAFDTVMEIATGEIAVRGDADA